MVAFRDPVFTEVRGPRSLVHGISDFLTSWTCPRSWSSFYAIFSGLVSLAREGPRRQIAERRVRPSGVVVLSPTFDPISGVVH